MITAEKASVVIEPEEVGCGAGQPDRRNPTDKCVTVVFNPVSGQEDPEERKRRIREALAEHGYRCQELITTPEQGARYWAEQAIKSGVDLLAVSGGDGTVVEVMTALIGTDVPLAIFPAGTGNLLSLNLHMPKEVPQAVHAALFGEKRKLDLAKITPHDPSGEAAHYAILAGAGYDAWIIKDADREAKNRLGMGAYLWAALKNLHHRPVVARLRLDGAKRTLRRRAKGIMVANMGRIQGDLALIPDTWPDDGTLVVAVLKAATLGGWLRLIASVLTRRLKSDPGIEYHRVRKVDIRLSEPQPLQYDGEVTETPVRSFSVEVVPSAVTVMIPKSALG